MSCSERLTAHSAESAMVFFAVVALQPMSEIKLQALAAHQNLSFGVPPGKFLAGIKGNKCVIETSPGIYELSVEARQLLKKYPATAQHHKRVADIALSILFRA